MQTSLLNRRPQCVGCNAPKLLTSKCPIATPVAAASRRQQPKHYVSFGRAAHLPVSSRCRPSLQMQAQEGSSSGLTEHPFPEEADFDLLTTKIAGEREAQPITQWTGGKSAVKLSHIGTVHSGKPIQTC